MLKSPFFEEEKIRTKPEAEWLYGQKKTICNSWI